ncbi:hypothetical protein JTE90_004868 [Oedothorax gibbosus]|uniref:Sushi domain-containing protein n=1 Tax=Oedothorax gibbosus TaxID=931172 RepID=A0AAV6US24_9ARAC|nr:hypothetical protein JTE90_004868 [Oedothorax gibbosus]
MGKLVVNWDICLALSFIVGILKISAQRQCPRLQKPWNGQFVGACNRHVGAECHFACREPYRLVGSEVRLCRTDGTWSGRTSACELDGGCVSCNGCNNCGSCSHSCNYGDSTCPALYPPNAGHTDGQCVPGIVGQLCFVTCDSGYVREGVPSLTCLENGQWSAQTPSCRRTSANVCESFLIPNGDGNCDLEGGVTVCRVSCHPGYMLVGTSYLTCTSSGNWNEPFPSCRSA